MVSGLYDIPTVPCSVDLGAAGGGETGTSPADLAESLADAGGEAVASAATFVTSRKSSLGTACVLGLQELLEAAEAALAG
mmetsp:Transcript_55032/g.160620  ORF Transcript_55032/g.160620 Transcript_55032/m.160620 type:complete len:80 (-) Transcript_55032:141-380(-)